MRSNRFIEAALSIAIIVFLCTGCASWYCPSHKESLAREQHLYQTAQKEKIGKVMVKAKEETIKHSFWSGTHLELEEIEIEQNRKRRVEQAIVAVLREKGLWSDSGKLTLEVVHNYTWGRIITTGEFGYAEGDPGTFGGISERIPPQTYWRFSVKGEEFLWLPLADRLRHAAKHAWAE